MPKRTCRLFVRLAQTALTAVVANKTDLCESEPTQLPQIQFGEAVQPLPERSGGDGLKPRAVSTLEGALFAKQHNLLYVETSAKEGWLVTEAFEWTARAILERVGRAEHQQRKAVGVNISQTEPKSGCC